jgi:hypothetical protein
VQAEEYGSFIVCLMLLYSEIHAVNTTYINGLLSFSNIFLCKKQLSGPDTNCIDVDRFNL